MKTDTKYGTVEGISHEGYTEYRGIPYAKPPVGELRWCPPQEPEPWEGILKADTFPPKCPQESSGFPLYTKEFYSDPKYLREESEDCLYLNIWAPEGAKDLPVAFWIHGGGFGGGFGSEIEFGGEEYCKKGVILVTIQYRVNIFGFLAHPWLSQESGHGVSGNYGILDQIAALKWVNENVAAFGGDPDNITLFGQSAGSSSVQALITTRLTKNWPAKAIMQSGACYPSVINPITLKEAEKVGEVFSDIAGADSLKALRDLSIEELRNYRRKMEQKLQKEPMQLVMVPNVDGWVLEKRPDELMETGAIKDIPYMLGSTEADLFVSQDDIESKVHGDLYKGCMGFSLKREELGKEPSYVYYFSHHLPGDGAGAFHSAELWYTFGTLSRCWRPMEAEDFSLSSQMVSYWINFMKQGDPNGQGLPRWEPCTREHQFVKEFS